MSVLHGSSHEAEEATANLHTGSRSESPKAMDGSRARAVLDPEERGAVGDVGCARIRERSVTRPGLVAARPNGGGVACGASGRGREERVDVHNFGSSEPRLGRRRFASTMHDRMTLSFRGEQDEGHSALSRRQPWPSARDRPTAVARWSIASRAACNPRGRPTRPVGSSPQGRRTHPEEVAVPPRSSRVEMMRPSWSGSLGTFEYELSRLYGASRPGTQARAERDVAAGAEFHKQAVLQALARAEEEKVLQYFWNLPFGITNWESWSRASSSDDGRDFDICIHAVFIRGWAVGSPHRHTNTSSHSGWRAKKKACSGANGISWQVAAARTSETLIGRRRQRGVPASSLRSQPGVPASSPRPWSVRLAGCRGFFRMDLGDRIRPVPVEQTSRRLHLKGLPMQLLWTATIEEL